MAYTQNDIFIPQHLTPYTHDAFMGWSVITTQGPLIQEYLLQGLEQVDFVASLYPRVYGVRLELLFPKWALQEDIPYLGNVLERSVIEKFISSLEGRISTDYRNRNKDGKRAPPTRVHWIRAYEIGDEEGHPHYHLMLLFNGDTYGALGTFDVSRDNLIMRIHAAWASALRVKLNDVLGLIHVAGEYRFKRDSLNEKDKCFKALSYLCKARTKPFRGRVHPFRCAPQKFPKNE